MQHEFIPNKNTNKIKNDEYELYDSGMIYGNEDNYKNSNYNNKNYKNNYNLNSDTSRFNNSVDTVEN